MPIDLGKETLQSLAQLAATIPGRGGKRVNSSTVFRWCARGIRRADASVVKLEHVRLGGRIVSSVEALSRFGQALAAEGETETPIQKRTPTQRERADAHADAQLTALGL